MQESSKSVSSSVPVKNKKLIITGALAALVACAICLVPPALLIVAGGGALAAVSTWLGYSIAAILLLASAVVFALWFHNKRKSA